MATEALEANLRRTAVEVIVPAEHELLLDITAPMAGIRRNTEELLREVHHAYIGWPETLADLHRRALSDFYYYAHHERAPEALAIFCDLYAKAVREITDGPLRADALRHWLRYLEKVVTDSDEDLARNLLPVQESLHAIGALVSADDENSVVASAGVRRLADALGQSRGVPDEVREQALDLLTTTLDGVYRAWLGQPDPINWLRERPSDDQLSAPLTRIEHNRLEEMRRELADIRRCPSSSACADRLSALPDHAHIIRDYFAAADSVRDIPADPWQGLVDRAVWLCRMVGHGLLEAEHERALREIRKDCREVVTGAVDVQVAEYLATVFAILGGEAAPVGSARLSLIRAIGEAAVSAGNARRVALVVDHILAQPFEYPGFRGFSDEWEVLVNPNHLVNIRTYLRLIELNSDLTRRLLEALVVHLQVGGAFIADTDLFQRDVSRLLGSDIGPVYQQVKQLLRLCPVYFNDIGAEGELRTASTRLDEICGRRDPLIHFVRKQSHVESNPRLVTFVEEIGRFWATGDPAGLQPYLPEQLYRRLDIDDDLYRGLHRVFARLARVDGGLDTIYRLPLDDALGCLEDGSDEDAQDVEKAGLLLRVHREMARKYALDHEDLLSRLRAYLRIGSPSIDALQAALDTDRLEDAVALLLEMLESLQARLLDPAPTEPFERIYHKRHIAAGIPSMYGRYREERFEAMGLTFRIESLAGALFDRLIGAETLDDIDEADLGDVARWLRLLLRALEVDGCRSPGLELACSVLEDALATPGSTTGQYVDIFRRLSRSVQLLMRTRYIDRYGATVDAVGGSIVAAGVVSAGTYDEQTLVAFTERIVRDLTAQSLALPRLDALVGKVLHGLARRGVEGTVSPPSDQGFDMDDSVVRLDGSGTADRGIFHLGNKGFMLTFLARHGFPVPDGFILTTDVFRCGAATPRSVSPPVAARVQEEVARLEAATGHRFGDPSRPLLLSVRAGAVISMPGMLTSFLNVGINPAIAEGLATERRRPWAAWDAYRRFIQFWGMSHGVERDLFDQLIFEAKQRNSVPKKALLPAAEMKDLALGYRRLVLDHGFEVIDDPFEQLLRCVALVLGSWDSDVAKMYRAETQIAQEWGSAVIVQRMVFGNLHDRSGTGVVLTMDGPDTGADVELQGDFIIQGQGDDVVSGLVETFPITGQRGGPRRDGGTSLQSSFPGIHSALATAASNLVGDLGLPHQEIEFTFESDRPEDLHILQSRDAVDFGGSVVTSFVRTEELDRSRLASGIGVGGGAFSGRLARSSADIEELRLRYPGDPILLVRPDTVPDDIPLLLNSDGLLTAVGGATSHAAVVAKLLGKPCVVGCKQLAVFDSNQSVELAGRGVDTGEFLSMSGVDGSVYLGEHTVTTNPVRIRR